jgi:hypothetical protein
MSWRFQVIKSSSSIVKCWYASIFYKTMITGLSLALMSNKFGLPIYDLQFWVRNISTYMQNRLREPHRAYFWMNRLVALAISDKSYGIRSAKGASFFMTTFRTVVSSVAKVCSLQNITLHSIHQCRFPTLVYPTTNHRATIAAAFPLFVDCFDFFSSTIRSRTIRRSVSISVSWSTHPDSSFLISGASTRGDV